MKTIRTSLLHPSPNNANQHDEKQLAAIAESIIHYGWTNPILVTKDNWIIAGHGRWEAAKRLGMETVPVLVVGDNWTDEMIRAYILADNALTKRSTWDEELLALELHDLHDAGYQMELTGFSADELAEYTGYNAESPMIPDDADPAEKKQTICPECGHKW